MSRVFDPDFDQALTIRYRQWLKENEMTHSDTMKRTYYDMVQKGIELGMCVQTIKKGAGFEIKYYL